MKKKGVSDKKIDEVYFAVELLMYNGCWNVLDELLDSITIKAWRIEKDILLAYATATLPAKSRLPSRGGFIARSMELHPNKKLWKGLK